VLCPVHGVPLQKNPAVKARIDVVSVVKVATIDQTLVFIYLRNDETSTKLQRNLNGKNTRKKKVENEVE